MGQVKKQVKSKIGLIFAFIFSFLGVALTSIALVLNSLTNLGGVSQNCSWQSVGDVKFSDLCKVSDQACKTQLAGELWLSFELGAIMFALIGCVLLGIKKHLVKYLFALCGSLCVCGSISWVAENPICYNTNLLNRKVGDSLIIAIVAGFFFFTAAILSSVRRGKKGGYTVPK